MILYIILTVLFLLFVGTTISGTLAERMDPGERAPVYYSDTFMSIINLFWIPSIIIFIILMFLNWKITLAVTVVGLFGGRILKLVAEHVIVFPLHKLLIKERQDNSF